MKINGKKWKRKESRENYSSRMVINKLTLIASDNQVFQKLTFLCVKTRKFIVFEKLDCNLQYHEFLIIVERFLKLINNWQTLQKLKKE
jgi:hypothetical protein